MEKKGWKITAIIFICLFVFYVTWFLLAFFLLNQIEQGEEEQLKCLTETCGFDPARGWWTGEYNAYDYIDGECHCYTIDNVTP